jgi:hypothetical protein
MLIFHRFQVVYWGSIMILLLLSCQSNTKQSRPANPPVGVVPVQITRTKTGYQILRGGKPYYIKGVSGQQQLDRVKMLGGNSIRLYTTNYADAVLDKAQEQGLTVMLGLWMKPEYEKFDYFDQDAVAQQKEQIRQDVLRYKNHPALLMWNVGNELDMHSTNPRSFQVLNDYIKMIHELDPYHPVTTALSGHFNMVAATRRFCPDLDILTLNVFDQLDKLSERLLEKGWDGPYIVGEFGARGWWEAPMTAWQAPLDQSSTMKAEYISSRFKSTMVKDRDRCLGSYVLYWGQRFEQTPMWFSLFTAKGEKTPVVDLMHTLWTGKEVSNKAPYLTQLKLNGQDASENTFLEPGMIYPAIVDVTDPEGDSLRVHWEVTPDINEMGALPQYRTAPEPVANAIEQVQGLQARVRAPAKRGPYRLMVSVYDGQGSVATHSYPFYVGTMQEVNINK